ncbi:MAG: hypothetical protein R3244_01270, partial [Thermoanaerobaculia bacterium]|nr:hypothetical protein [Thermoanaerobaculia bacterium]
MLSDFVAFWAGFAMGWLHPGMRNVFGGPMNGQQARRRMVESLCATIPFTDAVETGSYRGDSTGFLARGIPGTLFTIELQPFDYGFSKARYLLVRSVRCLRGDSRVVLPTLIAGSEGPWLLYLDAHWNEELPLIEEIDCIGKAGIAAVLVIDDFEVPGDPGYGFDDYGSGKALRLEFIEPVVRRHGLAVFFPAVPSDAETGACRGCVVLATPDLAYQVAKLPTLRRFEGPT